MSPFTAKTQTLLWNVGSMILPYRSGCGAENSDSATAKTTCGVRAVRKAIKSKGMVSSSSFALCIGIGLTANYNKKTIIQATTIKNAATIPKHPTGFFAGGA